jgi:hypothetical protein
LLIKTENAVDPALMRISYVILQSHVIFAKVIMKKILASVAVTIYFAFACGVIVNYHFCMDRYDSFSLYKSSRDWCGKCGMHVKKSHGCCHDEIKIIKLQDDHQVSTASFQFKSVQPAITFLPVFIVAETNNGCTIDHLNHPPPLLHGQDIYLQNCVFRI